MADFDTVSKHLIQTHPADFARFALQRDDIERVKVLDTEQPNVRRPDSLLRVRVGGKEVLVHHEFQTTDSTGLPMPRRMASYIGHLIGRYGLPVHSYVLYLRPNAGRRDPGYYIQEHPDHQVVIRYKVLRLSQFPGQAVLDSGSVGLLPFAPLMQPPVGQAEAAWLEQCVATAWDAPLAQSVKALRFQPAAVGRLADQIAAIDDVQHLKQLHRAAIQVPSLEAFGNLLDADE